MPKKPIYFRISTLPSVGSDNKSATDGERYHSSHHYFGKGNTPTLNKIYFSRACEILMIKSPIRSNSEIVSR